jgi:hypothetical protein
MLPHFQLQIDVEPTMEAVHTSVCQHSLVTAAHARLGFGFCQTDVSVLKVSFELLSLKFSLTPRLYDGPWWFKSMLF